MSCDFADSCQRHWDDAERLFSSGRWANADHLYGFSAESALKRLMLAFGMPFNAVRDMLKSVMTKSILTLSGSVMKHTRGTVILRGLTL